MMLKSIQSVEKSHAKLGIPDAKVLMMSGCDHHSCARFPSRENENYLSLIQKIKRIIKAVNTPQETSSPVPKRTKEAETGSGKGEGGRGNLSYITCFNIDFGSHTI